jgi:hypothetical protein
MRGYKGGRSQKEEEARRRKKPEGGRSQEEEEARRRMKPGGGRTSSTDLQKDFFPLGILLLTSKLRNATHHSATAMQCNNND